MYMKYGDLSKKLVNVCLSLKSNSLNGFEALFSNMLHDLYQFEPFEHINDLKSLKPHFSIFM